MDLMSLMEARLLASPSVMVAPCRLDSLVHFWPRGAPTRHRCLGTDWDGKEAREGDVGGAHMERDATDLGVRCTSTFRSKELFAGPKKACVLGVL